MTRYEQTFETEWESIDPEEAAQHAYAIGVAERLGEDNRSHLVRLVDAMDTGYARGLVELAYQEGRTEAKQRADRDGDLVWAELVDPQTRGGGSSDDRPQGLPQALDLVESIRRQNPDSREATERPDLLDR